MLPFRHRRHYYSFRTVACGQFKEGTSLRFPIERPCRCYVGWVPLKYSCVRTGQGKADTMAFSQEHRGGKKCEASGGWLPGFHRFGVAAQKTVGWAKRYVRQRRWIDFFSVHESQYAFVDVGNPALGRDVFQICMDCAVDSRRRNFES